MYPNITAHATACKVTRVQRLTRIFQRIWLRPDTPFTTQGIGPNPEAPSSPFTLLRLYVPKTPGSTSLVPRLYTISAKQVDEHGAITGLAVDVIVHDHLARFGVSGLTDNPQAAMAQNPMMAVGSVTGGFSEESLPPNVISDDDVEAGPGADWAANTRVGDKVLGELRGAEEELVSYAPQEAKALLLVTDPAGLPAVEQIVRTEVAAGRRSRILVFCQLPHKTDRRTMEGAEVFWVLPGEDLWEALEKHLTQHLTQFPQPSDWYAWSALEQRQLDLTKDFFRGRLGWPVDRLELHSFWIANH